MPGWRGGCTFLVDYFGQINLNRSLFQNTEIKIVLNKKFLKKCP